MLAEKAKTLDETCFEEVKKLSSGTTSAVVDLVRHKDSGIMLARKTIYLEVNASTVDAILMEIKALHRCHCRNIVEFFGAYATKYGISICMEFMDLGSITDIINKHGLLGEPQIGWVAVSVLKALRYLKEEMRILHRDVKPSNILVNSCGQVKLCDLGVSKSLIDSTATTYVGSKSYMAPERLNGQVYSSKSDVWSYGLTLFEAAIGRYPIPPPTRAELSHRFNVSIECIDEDIDPDSEEEMIWLQEHCDPKKLSSFDLLFYISEKAPPKLPKSLFSKEFIELIDKCLTRSSSERILQTDVTDLPFITMHTTEECQEQFKQWCNVYKSL
jgi:serine/threonine protein kinase